MHPQDYPISRYPIRYESQLEVFVPCVRFQKEKAKYNTQNIWIPKSKTKFHHKRKLENGKTKQVKQQSNCISHGINSWKTEEINISAK